MGASRAMPPCIQGHTARFWAWFHSTSVPPVEAVLQLPAVPVLSVPWCFVSLWSQRRPPPKIPSPPHRGADPEYSVARGIDFQNVAAVINFDVPPAVESYIHRVGR